MLVQTSGVSSAVRTHTKSDLRVHPAQLQDRKEASPVTHGPLSRILDRTDRCTCNDNGLRSLLPL